MPVGAISAHLCSVLEVFFLAVFHNEYGYRSDHFNEDISYAQRDKRRRRCRENEAEWIHHRNGRPAEHNQVHASWGIVDRVFD